MLMKAQSLRTLTAVLSISCLLSACGGSGAETPAISEKVAAAVEVSTPSLPYTRSAMDEPLPEFSFTDMLGNRMSNAELSGKITLVNFWATWCGPCIIEIPDLVVLYDEWQDRPFEIIGVSMDDEGFDMVKPFAEDLAINYPIVLDDGTFAEQFGGVYGLPTTFLVDENGKITDRFIGLFPLEEVKDELNAMVQRAGSN